MRSFMLIGVCDLKPHCICTVQAPSLAEAAIKLRGATFSGTLVGVPVSRIVGTQAGSVIFRPGKETGTVLESAIAELSHNAGYDTAFGDYLKRYTDWLLVEVASIN